MSNKEGDEDMRKYSDNKGFSLIELVISIAIIMTISGSIVSFLLAGSNSYSSVITTADLQQDAQLVMNQISDIVISAEKSVNFDTATDTLEVVNETEKYKISWDKSKKILNYAENSLNRTLQNPDSVLMAENISDFMVNIDNNKVKIRIKFENNSKAYAKEETITLRNLIVNQ